MTRVLMAYILRSRRWLNAFPRWCRGPWQLSQEMLALLVALYLSMTANLAFFRVVAQTGAFEGANGLWLGAALFIAITALNWFMCLLLVNRRTGRPVIALLLVVTAMAAHYMNRYTVYLDPDMIRNVLHTDGKEAAELLSPGSLPSLIAFGVIPSLALWRVHFKSRAWGRDCTMRMAAIAAALVLAATMIVSVYQPLASLMRNHKEVRYLVTPGNYLVSLASVLHGPGHRGLKLPVGTQAKVEGRSAHAKPRLLVLVVGETVRAQNWGLNSYERQTTPQLARIHGLINFPDVTACGSATEVSVPCMFSPYGRRDYDKDRIEGSEGLLHVLAHAGIRTLWRDNQGGCKGVCDGLPFESFRDAQVPGACNAEGCLDEVMLSGLVERATGEQGDMVVVLHQLGSHGPAYFKRYPSRLSTFVPACESVDLSQCSRARIVNAYDNSVLQTDDFLARTIRLLSGVASMDTAMLYVSDHGESLGEGGLYLHGVPYAIAPKTQTRVPMVLWLSNGFTTSRGLDRSCLERVAAEPASHDNLFPSVLALMQVVTPEVDPDFDLFTQCTKAAANADTIGAGSHSHE